MTTLDNRLSAPPSMRQMLNKVPEVTLYFWIIKVLATTVGETAADYLNTTLNYGLTKTTYIMAAILIAVLVVQFRARKYVPGIYWLAVVLISIVGTLITDNLADNYNWSFLKCTVVFAVCLAATFAAWYASEKSLSIHTITTTKREAFYWLTILFTFALGTAAGDLVAEKMSLGYWKSALLFAAIIAIIGLACFKAGLNAVLGFWMAYIVTRPLGASLGDYLSQAKIGSVGEDGSVTQGGGLNLGTTVTSAIFLSAILIVVLYISNAQKRRPAVAS